MMPFMRIKLLITVLLLITDAVANKVNNDEPSTLISSNHTRNVAVILSSSTFYHNYRHTTNALAIYKSLNKKKFCMEASRMIIEYSC